jgi:hypothetical protein
LTTLSISIVLYFEPPARLARTLAGLGASIAQAAGRGLLEAVALRIVDNTPAGRSAPPTAGDVRDRLGPVPIPLRCEVMAGHGNVGYGAGHNLAWRLEDAEYHLIMNPDVDLFPGTLAEALVFMARHPGIGLIAPAVIDRTGRKAHLCKRPPSVLDLALRGFAPASVRHIFRKRLHRYEARDRIVGGDAVLDPGLVSGSFMFFRKSVLAAVRGFDPRYFLYFEDFDLSLRTAQVSRIACVPEVLIVHHGGDAARKGWKHVRMFSRSALQYFGRHGWRWL